MFRLLTLTLVLALVGCLGVAPPDEGATGGARVDAVLECGEPCVVPLGTAGAEPWLALNPDDSRHAVAAAMRTSENGPFRFPWVVVSVTHDGGNAWEHHQLPGGLDEGGIYGFFADAMVEFAADGTVVVAGLVAEGGNFYCTDFACAGAPAYARSLDLVVWRSSDGGRSWGEPHVVAEALVGIVAVSAGPAGVYQQFYTTEAHDRELLIVDRVTGRLTIFWNGLSAQQVRMLESHSDDHGVTWSAPVVVPGAGYGPNAAAHGGHVVLTYKRGGQTSTFEALRSTDGGATWSEPVLLGEMPNPNWQPAPPVHWGGGMNWSLATPSADGLIVLAKNGTEWEESFRWTGTPTTKRDIGFAVDDDGRGFLAFYDGPDAHLMVAPFAAGVVGTPMRLGNTTTPAWLVFEYFGVDCGAGACMVVWPTQEPEYGLQSARFTWTAIGS